MTSEAAGSNGTMGNTVDANMTERGSLSSERSSSDDSNSNRMSWSDTNTPQRFPSSSDISAIAPNHRNDDADDESNHRGDADDDADSSSSDDSEGGSPFQVFKNLLSTREYTQSILEAEQGDLTRDERTTLARIFHHFQPSSPRKRKRGDEGPWTGPWAVILRLRQVVLPAFIQRHLARDPDGDPNLFLNDPVRLNSKNIGRGNNQTGEGEGEGQDEGRGRGFLSSLRYCKHAEYRGELDRARYLFAMLFFYDFVMKHYPGTKGRVGPVMEQDIKAYFLKINPPDLHFDDTLTDLRKYSLRGKRLNHICTHFGTGAILFLANELSQDFLDNKCPLRGDTHDQAITHLEDLSLAEAAMESGANQLGSNLRQQLLQQWDLPDREE